jgi:hypothetical protein
MAANRKHMKHTRPVKPLSKEQIALLTKQNLILVISLLLSVLFFFVFKIGGIFWPAWLVELRWPILYILIFVTIYISLFAPVMIEANSNPRPLSGPGRNHGTY